MMAVTWHEHQKKFREFIYEEILAYSFNNLCVYNKFVYDYGMW